MLGLIENKIKSEVPLSGEELLFLYNLQDMSKLASLANVVRERINGNKVYYNRNFHLEPSNVCRHRCKFCSYRRDSADEPGAWTMSLEQVEEYCRQKYQPGMTEVHIVGSVNPQREFGYYRDIIAKVRELMPREVKIKGYSAVEIWDMCEQAGYPLEEGLGKLIDAGLNAIPGGGAEIFNREIREKICPDKIDAQKWLQVHRVAHKLGLHTNATMLFGHIESREHRVEHLLMIRELQQETGGFDAFIPLKYRIANNDLGKLCGQGVDYRDNGDIRVDREVDIVEVLRTFAVSRIALGNVPHIKAYWPMLGKDLCQMALVFGADDMDGTINDSTKIYSMAGAEEQRPGLEVEQLRLLAQSAGFEAVERDSYYNIVL